MNVSIVSIADKTQYFTFVHTLASPYAQMSIQANINEKTSNCLMRLYSYGMPSDEGSEKYLLYTFKYFDSYLNTRFVDSAVLSFAATIEVPPGCLGTIFASKLNDFNFNTVSLKTLVNEGFLMSQGYPRPLLYPKNFEKGRPIQVTYQVDDFLKMRDSTVFTNDLVSLQLGSSGGFFQITIGVNQFNTTDNGNHLGFNGEGGRMQVLYTSKANDGAFLLRFVASTPSAVESTEIISTTSTTKIKFDKEI
ncbi:unnamed protein product, partial [Mesorhabditis belari]|uniref:Uncharacterized protein n=1 Tax=Mesorhabditis belari TaxID=2138241 RepID=A0AAF3FIV0_9BILA